MTNSSASDARFFAAWEVANFVGPVVAIDDWARHLRTIRAFAIALVELTTTFLDRGLEVSP